MAEDDDFGLSPLGKALVEGAYPELKAGNLPDIPPDPSIFQPLTFDRKRRFTMADLEPFLDGEMTLPNVEPVDPLYLLNAIASGGHMMTAKWGYATLGGTGIDANRKQWTQFFLQPYEGEGYAVTYGGSRWDDAIKKNIATPITVSFALCRHTKVEHGTPNHSRGWHPGHCSKCGLDMSVDSGD